MRNIEKALRIALVAHRGQVDKGGMPYIFHPIRVSENVDTVEEKIVALLHDVVEDSTLTIREIAHEFPAEICDAVEAITKKEGQDYSDYLKTVKENKLARIVKLADLQDNMDKSRLPDLTDKDLERFAKYHSAKLFLKS